MAFLNNFLPIFLWSIKITNFTASLSPELKIILIRLIRLFFQDSFQQRLTPGHLHFEKWISSMFLMTRTLSKNVRIAIVSAGTFTFWKTWIQACSSWPEHSQKTWGSPSYPPGHLHFEKWISNMFLMTRTLSKNVRIPIVSAGIIIFAEMKYIFLYILKFKKEYNKILFPSRCQWSRQLLSESITD